MSMQGYETWARAAGRAFALAEDWRVPEAILRVQEHQRRGDDVHLVTASELTLVSAYLEGIGLAGVTIHASRLEKGASGIRFSWHNYGARKVMTLRGQGVRIADALLYTDSAADLPLALHTGEAVLVNPHPRDIRHFRRAGLEPRIERWS
jgi:phosphoserine phosphatase